MSPPISVAYQCTWQASNKTSPVRGNHTCTTVEPGTSTQIFDTKDSLKHPAIASFSVLTLLFDSPLNSVKHNFFIETVIPRLIAQELYSPKFGHEFLQSNKTSTRVLQPQQRRSLSQAFCNRSTVTTALNRFFSLTIDFSPSYSPSLQRAPKTAWEKDNTYYCRTRLHPASYWRSRATRQPASP